ncbi:MAG: hypothetical protein EHM48_05550 [Planctomycetaceae bacterium]|nr:MAG: hypothetical protein EHM48_05550 [Planctomycetaceae bacterium]
MKTMKFSFFVQAALCLTLLCGAALAQKPPAEAEDVDAWVTATGQTSGVTANARDEAEKLALRKAVEMKCGLFIKAQSKVKDYQAVYDKVLSNTVGYVLEFKVVRVDKTDDTTSVTVKARVSTKKFEENWASIAHTINEANNPRVVLAVSEATSWTTSGPAYETSENGTVQTSLESFFDKKGISLMDRQTAAGVSKRDLMLAVTSDDVAAVAAVGARFKADVVIIGKANAKLGKKITVGDTEMYQYTVSINLRAVQTDSARILMSKNFTETVTELQRNAEDKALSKVAEKVSPKALEALVEAWAKRSSTGGARTVELYVSGMDYDTYKAFKAAADKIRGVQAVRMREITESVATIDIEYELTNENLADRLSEIKEPKLKVIEINPNRIKLKIVKE